MSEKESVSSSNASEEKPLLRKRSSICKASDSTCSSDAKNVQASKLDVNFRASAPAHKRLRESPLSSDAIFHQSHAGLFNLCVVILVAVNSRLIIENLMKYGLLIRAGFWFSSKSIREWPVLMCGLSLPLLALCSYAVEKMRIYFHIPESIMSLLHFVISTSSILYPVYIIMRVQPALIFGINLMLFSITYWMKLVSYAHTNYDFRCFRQENDKDEAISDAQHSNYPQNISLKGLAYFMVAPTLCYQASYPRTNRIRKRWVFRQVVKLLIFTGLMGFIIEQYVNPTIQNSQHPLKGNYVYAIERVLKLSVPTLYVWLCIFYTLFHLWLNIIAELTYFGDREFYKDWWNASTVEEYWKSWNMPVHRWMVRHIYFPCLRKGISRDGAVLISFIISGVFHELCIGIPCHMFRCWAFLGIMFQVPLMVLTNYLHNKFQSTMVGNIIFWVFFCIVGQPISVLLYYHDYINQKSFPIRS
ncbi:hypothetical protein KP509_30G071900 [Ceratopteris richardii]|uniref:O-acyltransferase n=1 Tax=Ceratopteris richardii TaxID=49495 RepID=A0A8T2R3N0_CERRI|nr:hypothetical protein KP509_30G071900 [Ceratopteris richardii]KAH7290992.1 hypothetical protein KP509_30G071900 [Ceratopteris richardii]